MFQMRPQYPFMLPLVGNAQRMPHQPKIATCCYCGTRAALVLAGLVRQELACSNCGAPLSELKMLKVVEQVERVPTRTYSAKYKRKGARPSRDKRRKPKRRQSLSQMIMRELWEVSDDIFDDVFDIFD